MNEFEAIALSLNVMAAEVLKNAKQHGWYEEGKEKTFGEAIALMHSELSEALEEYRDGREVTEIYYTSGGAIGEHFSSACEAEPKPCGVPIELADCLIRILDTCAAHGINIGAAVAEKHFYNTTRPYRHGGKLI